MEFEKLKNDILDLQDMEQKSEVEIELIKASK
jgi:hypothetical protein